MNPNQGREAAYVKSRVKDLSLITNAPDYVGLFACITPKANAELEQEENSIRNWFSYDLVNAQRTKIKNLINELSKIEKKKELCQKMKEQNEIIEKYMSKQKEEFDKYFSNLND